MAIFKRKASVPVVDQLAVKGSNKYSEAERKRQTAASLAEQAANLHQEANVDTGHADAIARAVDILDKAGVKL